MWRQGICRGVLLVTVAPGAFFGVASAWQTGEEASTAPPLAAPRVECAAPRTLRLRRFEDRSAQLLCGHRVIVRISVPG